jgi:hypothetical protein
MPLENKCQERRGLMIVDVSSEGEGHYEGWRQEEVV